MFGALLRSVLVQIQPKTPAAVREWVAGGGKLKVGGDVLVGLHRWETLVEKPEAVDQLLANMSEELNASLETPVSLQPAVFQ